MQTAFERHAECPNLQQAINSGGDLDNDAAFEFILDAIAARLPKRRH